MPEPDHEGARQLALDRLARELSPALRYHSLAHTRDDVVVAAERLAELEGLPGADRQLLLTAAYFHDIGYVKQRDGHEAAGVAIIRQVLPGFGFDDEQVEVISRLILATRVPQTPRTLAEQILTDADLDVLGREDLWTRHLDLRAEREAFGSVVTDDEWYRGQVEFMRRHRYFTASARRLRDAAKRANLVRMLGRLRLARPPAPQG